MFRRSSLSALSAVSTFPLITVRAREQTVKELNLQNLTDDEAIQLLELANEGVYDTDDMPE